MKPPQERAVKITLPMTPKKIAVLALFVLWGIATATVAVLLFDPEQLEERTNPAFIVAPLMSGTAVSAWVLFLHPKTARLNGTLLLVREPRRVSRVDLAKVADVSFDQAGPVLVFPRAEVEGELVHLPLGAAKEAERAAVAAALDANESAAAKEAAARLRMPSIT